MADSCKTKEEQAKQVLSWEKVDLDFNLPDEFNDVLDEYQSTSDTVQEYLDLAQTLLDAAKLFLLGQANPILLAVALILSQVKTFINEIRNTGVYAMYIIPEEGVGEFVPFADLIPGFSEDQLVLGEKIKETDGIYMLDTETILSKFISSFTDGEDGDRPPFGDDSFAGGTVLFAGTSGNIIEMLRKMSKVAKLFGLLFDSKQFKDLEKSMLAAIKAATDTPFSPDNAYGDGKSPNWQGIRPIRDFFITDVPIVDNGIIRTGLLDTPFIKILAYIEALENQVKAAVAIVELQVKFIEERLKQIQEIKDMIDEITEFARAVRDGTESLENFQVASLTVPPQTGGLSKLKKAIKDETLEGRPTNDLTMTTMVSLVGGGTGLSVLLYILGITDEIEYGVGDTSNLEEEQLKKDFSLYPPEGLDFPPNIPSPPDPFNLADYLPNVADIISGLLP